MPAMSKRTKIKGKGSRVFRSGDEIVCTTDRYVVSWGYDYEYDDAKREVAKECGIENEFKLVSKGIEWEIFEKHSDFKECREALWSAQASFWRVLSKGDPYFRFKDVNPQYFASRYVRKYIYARLKEKLVDGTERKIVFGTITTPPKHYRVEEVKVIQTGRYFPPNEYGTRGDWENYEWEPGGLTDRKTYKLVCGSPCTNVRADPPLDKTRKNSHTYWCGRRVWLLADDCRFLYEMKVAERLSGEKLKWEIEHVENKDAV